MTIEELADVINVDLIIRRYANQTNRYIAEFEHTEIKNSKDDRILAGIYGNSTSPAKAIQDYIENITGKWLVIDAGSKDNRREFGVPATLDNYLGV